MFSNSSSSGPARILLVRPKYHTGLSRFGSINTEPLELEYLAKAVIDQGHAYQIWDGQFDGSLRRTCTKYQPDLVAITGYYPARDQMLVAARTIRSLQPKAVIVIGGVHAELNQRDFQQPEVDLIVHSGGFFTFEAILAQQRNDWPGIAGISWQDNSGQWQTTPTASFDPHKLPQPDRSYFHTHKHRFSWLYHGPAALVKTAFGCPYSCSFCYCRLLNNGVYQPRETAKVVEEIKTINCSLIWLIDDTFLLDRQRLRSFAAALQEQGVEKKFIIYGRADFICQHPETLPLLKEIGVIEVIIGLEAIDNQGLEEFNKQVNADQNRECVRLLRQHHIGCIGLFIMGQQATAADFRRLDHWIEQVGLTMYTISVFSPFPGTKEYPALEKKLLTTDCRKWDLLHLVLPPNHLSRLGFMGRIWWLHAKLLRRNRRLRRHLLTTAFNLAHRSDNTMNRKDIWDFWAKYYDRLWLQRVSLQPTRALVCERIMVCKKSFEKPSENNQNPDQATPPLNILDMGCGTGQLYGDLVQSLGAGNFHYSGIDSSKVMVEQAMGKFPEASFRQNDVMDAEPEGTPFDLIVCSHSFPYYPDGKAALEKMAAMLKPGGQLLLSQACTNGAYDAVILKLTGLTTSKASYRSSQQMAELGNPLFRELQSFQISDRVTVPSLWLFQWVK